MDDKQGYLRLNHFHGLRLESTDFQVGETYHLEKKKLHNKVFHGYGVVQGYSPAGDGAGLRVLGRRRGDMSVEVTPGYAIDGEGNDVFLYETEVKQVDPSKYRLPQDVFVILKYVDEPTEFTVNAANPKYKGHRRVLETSKVEIVASEPDPEEGIELARVHVTSETTEIKDAQDPEDPKPGEIDLRYAPRAGVCGTQLEPEMLQRLREVLAMMRREFSHLAVKFKLQAARDVRGAVISAQFMAHTNLLCTQRDVTMVIKLIVQLQEELLSEFMTTYPELTDTREYASFKENVYGILHLLKSPRYSRDEFNSILSYHTKTLEAAHGIGEMEAPEPEPEPEPEPAAVVAEAAPEPEESEPEPEPEPEPAKPTPAPGAKSLTWDELQALSGELPDKIFLDGVNYNKTDEIKLVDRKDEAAHEFKMDEYKDKWSTNQTYMYPDKQKITARGQAHVGGYSQWKFKNLEPGKDLIIAKRIDYAYSGLVTGIHVDGEKVGEWVVEGQDRKFRWRNWLFKVPGEYIKGNEATIKQVCLDAEREVNMFKLWCYQAAD